MARARFALIAASLLTACGDSKGGGENRDGSTMDPDDGGGGGGGSDASSSDLDGGVQGATPEALFRAVCDWEFRCCTRGELDYRLGPFTTDVDSCVERFSFELRESNSSSNPFRSGAGADLLGYIAYRVNLERVQIHEEGIAACIASWDERACHENTQSGARCEGPTLVGSDPCSFRNLFKPALELGEECDPLLAESSFGNDIECKAGSTCVGAGSTDNPSSKDVCIKRRVEGEFCTRNGECDFDLYCSSDGKCEKKADIGEACSFRNPENPSDSQPDVACKEGLSCHPVDLKCVANCAEGARCSADSECPEGLSCVRVELESGAGFQLCQKPSAGGPCDSHADCPDTQYCDATVPRTCLDRAGSGEPCTPLGAACQAGFFCSETCQPLLDAGQPCSASTQCDPEKAPAGCIYDPTDDRSECAAEHLELGEPCTSTEDCASSICETVEVEAGLVCTKGVGAGEPCDTLPANAELPTCALDHVCLEGMCVKRLDPGEECIDPATGNATPTLCKGSTCQTAWDRRMCTDAPIPVSMGGTGVTCGGT